MPISIHLRKLLGRAQLRVDSLPKQHALRALLDRHHSKDANLHATSTTCLTAKQNIKLKSPIQDINHRLNQIHPAFDSMNQELRPGLCIVDLFANQLSFHTVKRSDSVARANHTQKLNNILLSSTSQPNTIIVITDASVRKGHYAISIAHGWQSRRLVFNSEYAAVNVTPAEAETFALRDGIGQATSLEGIDKIVVITDSISCAQKLFDMSNHPKQGHTIAISRSLRPFLSRDPANSIQFWDCPSEDKWPLHYKVDQQAKSHLIPVRHPNKESWEFCRQSECKDLTKEWQMLFENAPYKGSQFLDTYNDDGHLIIPSYTKGGSWLNTIGISNSICARATRLITNHAPIGEYKARFFPREVNSCPCNNTQLET